MKTKVLLSILLTAGGLLFPLYSSAQSPSPVNFPAASPGCTIKQRVGLTDIEVVYSRPGIKGRTVFGGIVPYDTVWRTGANAATRITFSTPVKLEGNDVPAGTYSLFTIPGTNDWTIIINKNAKQFGAFQYDSNDDLVRFQVTPGTWEDTTVETFTIEFSQIRDDSADLLLLWDKTVVPIHLQVDVVSKIVPQIEAAMAAPGKKSDGFYFQAASFYYDHDLDLNKALDWANAGLADKPMIAFEILHLKAQILAKQGDKAGAIAAAKQSSELAIKAEGPGNSFVWMNDQLISSLQ
ncbi:MAG TPA: DUF2911 domain-containing protein [Alphaproteobacteria bacterium]|nr:DUF2911 domain-containing protein [Alphaproteobacteria bacterium]